MFDHKRQCGVWGANEKYTSCCLKETDFSVCEPD